MSALLRLIEQMDWQDVLALMEEKHINVKEKGNLVIFNYIIDADFSDPIVCEARGVIVDREAKKIVCRGFDKFFNSAEPYAADINWATAKVQEKIDGSIIKLYWYNGEWRWATNGMIDACDAEVAPGLPVSSFMEIIVGCANYQQVVAMQPTLDKDHTYIFELVSPYNRMVVRYAEAMLYHIGTRNNLTGMETTADLPMLHPKEYPIHTLSDCMHAVAALNDTDGRVKHEGFVVVDGAFRRIKIKTPEYVYIHHALNNHKLSKRKILELIENEDFNVEAFVLEFPEYKALFAYYIEQLETVDRLLEKAMIYGRKKYLAVGGDRKRVWQAFQETAWKPFSFAGMMAVGNDIPIAELKRRIPKNKIHEFVMDYTTD